MSKKAERIVELEEMMKMLVGLFEYTLHQIDKKYNAEFMTKGNIATTHVRNVLIDAKKVLYKEGEENERE